MQLISDKSAGSPDVVENRPILSMLNRAIEKIGDGNPPISIHWKSANHPLGQTSFLRFDTSSLKPICAPGTTFVRGYAIDVWLNDCGNTYKTTWRFDYFAGKDSRVSILEKISNL